MNSDGTHVLAVAVNGDAAFVFVPQRSRINNSLGRYPYGTSAITHLRGIRSIGVRYPVRGVLRLALWRNCSDQHNGS